MNNQVKGLLDKSLILTLRQKGSLICQITTPLLCLGLIAVIKLIVESKIDLLPMSMKLEFPIPINTPILSKLTYFRNLTLSDNCDQWYIFKFDDKITEKDKEYFGENEGNKSSIGILNKLRQIPCETMSKSVPYFKKLKDKNVDDYLYDTLLKIDSSNFADLISNETLIKDLPDGSFIISESNNNRLVYLMSTDDKKIPPYHRSNGITKSMFYNKGRGGYIPVVNVIQGVLTQADIVNQAYFSKIFNGAFVQSSIQIMPFSSRDNDTVQRIINVAGASLYPLAISLLMPLFMYNIILEKDSKLIEIMKINGLKMTNYWVSNFIFDYGLYMVTAILFVLFGGPILGLSLFTQTSYLIQFLMYFGWGICQVSLAFFFQAFLTNPRSATILGYVVSIWTTLNASTLNVTIFQLPQQPPYYFYLYPNFTLARLLYILSTKCAIQHCVYTLQSADSEIIVCLMMLFFVPWIYLILGIYLYEIIPQKYGVQKPLLFFLKNYFQKSKSRFFKSTRFNFLDENGEILELAEIENLISIVKNKNENKHKYALITKNLTKIYENSNKYALENLNLSLKYNEIVGLLGPNGAGKTTFFSILTGIFEATTGDAWVGGYSVSSEIEKVQELIGFCPQFDLLWEDLTVEEHLQFYSTLKNVKTDVEQNLELTLKNIKLTEQRNFKVSQLSGGMKRRLSLGISLVGQPKIVFLDEPTTGLDPENKRQIWEILSVCKEGKCMILTTHLMDEAEVLCDRIGILAQGSMKCFGTKFQLKKELGSGFKIVIRFAISVFESGLQEKISELFNENFPRFEIFEKFDRTLVLRVNYEDFNAETLFTMIEANKEELLILEWAVSQITLEDIFISLTEKEI